MYTSKIHFLCSDNPSNTEEESILKERAHATLEELNKLPFAAIFSDSQPEARFTLNNLLHADKQLPEIQECSEIKGTGDDEKDRRAMEALIKKIRGDMKLRGNPVLIIGNSRMGQMFQLRFLDKTESFSQKELPLPYSLLYREFQN